MDGSEKYPLLVIGKFKNPRAFKNVTHLPLNYDHNKKAWMTGKIFVPFMRKMNNQFKAQKRQVAIILDNCSAHPPAELTDFSNIKFFSLPPNTTSASQPMDAGIIKNMKKTGEATPYLLRRQQQILLVLVRRIVCSQSCMARCKALNNPELP